MAWENSVLLKIDHTKIDSALSDFPILVHLSNSSGITDFDVTAIFTELGANSKKIKIETSTPAQCYVEIERWDNTNNEAWLWVKVPSISDSADTELTLYYDASEADNTTYVGDTGSTPAQNVWGSDFAGVWHKNSNLDSTSNDNNITFNGASALSSGKIAGAYDYDGVDDRGVISDTPDLDIGTGDATLEAVVKLATSQQEDYAAIVGKGWLSGSNKGHGFTVKQVSETGKIAYQARNLGDAYTALSDSTHNNETWVGLAGRLDRSSSTGIQLFVDGVVQTTKGDGSALSGINIDNSVAFTFGTRDEEGTGVYKWDLDGAIDEVRLSKTARSDAWLKATHHSNFDSLITYSSSETEELEDISLDLSAYYQSLENFGTWLRAHDGLEFEDLASQMEAAGWTTEDLSSYLSAWYESLENAGLSLNTWGTGYEDLQSWLAAFHRSLEDAKTDLSIVATAYEHWTTFLWAAATERKDLSSSLQAYGRELQDLPSFLRAVGYRTEDLKGYFEAVSSTVLASLGLFLTATDGVTLSDLCVILTAVKKSPQFRSVVAQRVSSVISEVV